MLWRLPLYGSQMFLPSRGGLEKVDVIRGSFAYVLLIDRPIRRLASRFVVALGVPYT